MSHPIVIIGSGMAGYAVAREFRKLNADAPLLMITHDDGTSYSKPLLSTGFGKGKTPDDLAMASAVEMSEQLNMSIQTKTFVERIDTDAQTIQADGITTQYDKLVLATGASPNVLPFVSEQNGTSRICSINNLDDYRRFRSLSATAKRVAIIGTGLIGCEFANDLLQDDYQVDLIGPTGQVLDTLLPSQAATCVSNALKEAGVTLHTGKSVTHISEGEDGVALTLDDNETLQADIVISAIGLKPNLTLAKDAGLNTNKGIVCDRSLQCSAPNVFTIGDCAEVDGHVLLYVLPLMACARALAKTLNGETTDVHYGVMPVAVKTTVCPVVVQPPLVMDGTWEVESDGTHSTSLYKNSAGELLGFALTGDATKQKQALSKLVSGIHN